MNEYKHLTHMLCRFHRDEGLELLQVMMIVAIAAMIPIAAATISDQIPLSAANSKI